MCDKVMNVYPMRGSGSFHLLWMCDISHSVALYFLLSSWTEDTRSCIFSDTALHLGKDGQQPLAAELDTQIEQKFDEFDKLAATGRDLLDSEHHLTQMVSIFCDL